MCGRYALNENARELADHFHLVSVPELVPRFNIPPGVQVLVIRHSVNGPIGEMMLWGLAPAWTRSAAQSRAYPKPINARAESIQERPMFRSAFRARRCILPASGFYEWHRPEAGPKQAYYFHPANDPVFAMAGLFEPGDGDSPASCCILTTAANEVMAPVHDRMPVLLELKDVQAWLDPTTSRERLLPLLAPAPSDEMFAHPVSARVNAARNDDSSLIERCGPAGEIQ